MTNSIGEIAVSGFTESPIYATNVQPAEASHLSRRPNPNGSHEDHVMAEKAHPTPDVLRQLLRYDPDTGDLFWKYRPVEWFANQHFCDAWNTRRAGKLVGSTITNYYKRVVVLGNLFLQHRVAFAIHTGEWPRGYVDHINGNTADNRFENLRDVDFLGNAHNVGISVTNKSGVLGVHLARGKWVSQIRVNGIAKHLGRFNTIEEATAARRAAELVLGYHENHGQRLTKRARAER